MTDTDRESDNRRVYWHSRRGMVELDVLLMPFALEVYPEMDDLERTEYKRFLASEDADLYAWLMGHADVDDDGFRPILHRIRDHARSKAPT